MTDYEPAPPGLTDALTNGIPVLAEALRLHVGNVDSEFDIIRLGALGAVIVELTARGDLEGPAAMFGRLEVMLTSPRAAREALVTGLLEGIQNVASGEAVDTRPLEPLMGPETLRMWRALDDLWAARLAPDEFDKLFDDPA